MVFLFFISFGFLSCWGDDESDDDSAVIALLLTGSSSGNVFYNSVRNTLPKFEASSKDASMSRDSGHPKALESGTILYDIYTLLRNYEYPTHEGIIDMHNIYKVIYTAGQIYSDAESGCSTITEAAVQSPFDLGLSDTYTCAGNSDTMSDTYAKGYAIKESGNTKYGLLTYRWAPDTPTHEEHGVLQASYNETTGDLTIRMVHLVYYESQEGFVVRSHITGNDQTHAFTVQMITTGTGSSPSYTSLVGKGISQGDGNYFLLKVNNSSGVSGNYFCVPATATGASLEDIHTSTPTGSTTVDTGCSTYQTDVDALDFLTTGDVPTALSDFTNSSILLSY